MALKIIREKNLSQMLTDYYFALKQLPMTINTLQRKRMYRITTPIL